MGTGYVMGSPMQHAAATEPDLLGYATAACGVRLDEVHPTSEFSLTWPLTCPVCKKTKEPAC